MAAQTKRNNTPIVVGAIAIVALLAVIAAVLASSGKDDDAAVAESVPFQQVTVTGDPLPPQYADAQSQATNEAAGAQAPDLIGKNFTGEPVSIVNDGKAKVVVFYAHWCPHCQKELPLIVDWQKANKTKYPNVDLYAVATGTTPTRANYPPAAWFKDTGYVGPILVDNQNSAAAAAYGLGSYPFIVALDKQNKVITRTSGEIPMSQFEDLFQRASA